MTVRVAIVDDQHLVRSGFAMILGAEDDIEVVGEAADGLAAVSLVEQATPDVVLMDVRMPHLDGIEATKRIVRDLGVPTRVLVLTTFDLDQHVFDAVRAGASGFLLKDTPPERLVEAVRLLAEGAALIDPAVTRALIEEFARGPSTSQPSPPALDTLTDREREVLGLVARGMSNGEIADHLVLGETTVKTHVGRVLSKLGLRDRVQAVVFAYEHGVVLPGQQPTA